MRTRMTLLFLALSLTLCPVFGATVKASLDRNRVDEGETVVLSVMASGDASATPDLAPLGTDFDVLNQNQSTTMRVVNGRSSSSRQWQIVLAPKRVGKLTVPALAVGSDHSESLTLDVLPAAEAAKQGSQRALLLEVEAEPRNPYVQGEVLYTVRVLSRIGLRDAQLSEPQAGDAIVERLGEDTATSTYRNGQQYQVVERRYAIFPQHSGELKIDPPVLTAQVPDQNRRGGSLRDRFFGSDPFAGFGRDPFAGFDSMFQQTRPVQVRARAVDLNVRPRSAAAGSPWLPARSISLAENWSPDPPVFHVGEPVTRSITIRARGLSPTQLPDLTTALPEGIKDYVDKALTDSQWHGDEIVSQKTFKTALVPSRQGSFTLPAVSLTWWDTQTDQARVATLPERTIEVLPAAAGQSATVPLPQQLPTTASPLQAPSSAAGDLPLLGVGRGLRIHSIAQAGYWPWIAVILAVAWVISTMGWWRARSRGKPAHPSVRPWWHGPTRPSCCPNWNRPASRRMPGRRARRLSNGRRRNGAMIRPNAWTAWPVAWTIKAPKYCGRWIVPCMRKSREIGMARRLGRALPSR